MAILLAFDLGTRRTGVALGDDKDGTVVALTTLETKADEQLIDALSALIVKHHATTVVVGLPLLPGGQEGSQAAYCKHIASLLSSTGVTVEFLDERYTTDASKTADGDAKAACQLLITFLDRRHLTKS